MLRVEEGGVVRVVQILVHVLSVLLEAPLEPVTGPLQGVLDLIPLTSTSTSTERSRKKEKA